MAGENSRESISSNNHLWSYYL